MVHTGCAFVAGIHPSRIFKVRAMEFVCAQNRPRFILSSEIVWGNGVMTHVKSKEKVHPTGEKSSEEDRTHDDGSHRTTRSNLLSQPVTVY